MWLGLNWEGLLLRHDLLGERILELLWLELLLNLTDLLIVQQKVLITISRMIMGIGGFCMHRVWDAQLIRWLLLLSSVVVIAVKASSTSDSGARQDAVLIRSHQLLILKLHILWIGVHLLLLLQTMWNCLLVYHTRRHLIVINNTCLWRCSIHR